MRASTFLAALLSISTPAFADSYSCHVAVNVDRGIELAMDATVEPFANGGTLSMTIEGRTFEMGKVEVTTLTKSSSAFALTLGRIGESDVSGIHSSALGSIDRIEFARLQEDEREMTVYRIFSGTKQLGGTFESDGIGSACLPK